MRILEVFGDNTVNEIFELLFNALILLFIAKNFEEPETIQLMKYSNYCSMHLFCCL